MLAHSDAPSDTPSDAPVEARPMACIAPVERCAPRRRVSRGTRAHGALRWSLPLSALALAWLGALAFSAVAGDAPPPPPPEERESTDDGGDSNADDAEGTSGSEGADEAPGEGDGADGDEASAFHGPLKPARFTAITDGKGFRWQFQRSGGIVRTTRHALGSNSMVTEINGSRFQGGTARMTADGLSYRIDGPVGGMTMTRRIHVDKANGAVHYLDTFSNKGDQPAPVAVVYYLNAGGALESILTERGETGPRTLGNADRGLILIHPEPTKRPHVLLQLRAAGSTVKPNFTVHNRQVLQLRYTFTIDPRSSGSLVLSLAQRGALPADRKALPEAFDAMGQPGFLEQLPDHARADIRNLGSEAQIGPHAVRLVRSLEALGIEPTTTDILALGEDTQLRGTAKADRLVIETTMGRAEVPLDGVAAILGERFTGGPDQILLRDGQVLTGAIEAEGLGFTLGTGMHMPVAMASLDRLVLATSRARSPGEAVALLELADGNRLAVLATDAPLLRLITPWGTSATPLGDIAVMESLPGGEVGRAITLKDGSRLYGFPVPESIRVQTPLFPDVAIHPSLIERLTALDQTPAPTDAGTETDRIRRSHVRLVGDSRVSGRIDLPTIHVVASGVAIPLPPGQIKLLTNLSDPEVPSGQAPTVSVELWDGGTVQGRLRELILPIRDGESVIQVPARDVTEVHVRSPILSDEMRTTIAGHIQALGDVSWTAREAATDALRDLGAYALPQLREILDRSRDPEVRRRAKRLIEEME